MCTYCMHLLVSNSLSLSSAMTTGEYLTYSKVSHHSFYRSSSDFLRRNAFTAQILTDVFLCITQIFVCSVYLVFISKNFEQVTPNLILHASHLETSGRLLLWREMV